jgi:erythromycin esterase-like protein
MDELSFENMRNYFEKMKNYDYVLLGESTHGTEETFLRILLIICITN